MVHMERDKGYRAGGAVMDEVSIGRFAGRGFGKTHALAASQAELEELYAAKRAENQARLDRKRERQALELYRRRYEFPTGARTGGATAPVACPHMRKVWFQVKHPRYGEDVPVYESALRKVKAKHDCVAGVTR